MNFCVFFFCPCPAKQQTKKREKEEETCDLAAHWHAKTL